LTFINFTYCIDLADCMARLYRFRCDRKGFFAAQKNITMQRHRRSAAAGKSRAAAATSGVPGNAVRRVGMAAIDPRFAARYARAACAAPAPNRKQIAIKKIEESGSLTRAAVQHRLTRHLRRHAP
jgi:hypothetical protein